ncbi:MAG: hypothetical protein WCH42_07255 [Actinomycetes bacterium]
MSEILFRRQGGKWTSPTISGYTNEADLVKMIADFPELLPGVSADSFVCLEYDTYSGPIDILIINSIDGSITLVECKLASNPEVRRKIIGQIIDYAASLRSMNFEDFHDRWIKRGGPNLENILVNETPLALTVADNLRAARFTLLLAVDAINEPLKQMTIYVNEKTDSTTRVALIELARHGEGDVEVVIPQTFGYEASKPGLDPYSARISWTLDDLRAWLNTNEPSSLPKFNELLDALKNEGLDWVGTKAGTPSGASRFRSGKNFRYPIFFHTYDIATLEVAFGDMREYEFVSDLLDLLRDVPEVNSEAIRAKNFGAYPKIALSRLSDPKVMNAVVDACKFAKAKSQVK